MANFNELKSILQKHIDEAVVEMSNNDNWAEMGGNYISKRPRLFLMTE